MQPTTSQHEKALLEGAFHRSADAITFVGPQGLIDCNEAVLSMFGYADKAEFLAQHPSDFSPERQPDGSLSYMASEAHMQRARDAGHTLFEWVHRRRDGATFPAEVMIVAFDLAGEQALAVTVRDITRRKQADAEIERQREALHQSQKMAAMGSLLAGVAHELNNPLSIVLNHAVMLGETSSEAMTIERARKIEEAATRCARIIRSFLAIARQRPPSREAVNAGSLIERSLDLTAYGLRSSGVAVTVAVSPDCPTVWGDADQLSQVLMNLIVNAQQAMDGLAGPRTLLLEAGADAGGLKLVVQDNGPGIDRAVRSRIFDPFFTTKPVGSGTGIGLSLSRSILAGHEGSIQVEDAPGGGARFVVRLPAGAGQAAGPEAGPVASRPIGLPRVLVADDEPEVAGLLAEILRRDAERVDLAANGAEALELVEAGGYDVILSDLRMPVMDGQALHGALTERGLLARTGMVFLTGDTLSAHAQEFLERTGAAVIEKPFTPAEVRRAVSEAVERLRAG